MIISAQTLVTGDGKTVQKDSGVLIQDGKITAIDKTAALLQANPNEEHMDYGAATILPGLIDMHMHLALYAGRQDEKLYTPHLASHLAYSHAHRFLVNGVTTLRDAYSPDSVCRQLVHAASRGFVKVPRIFYPNLALTTTGGLDWNVNGTVQVDGVDEIRKAVRQQIRSGATWIKAMCDANYDQCEFEQAELNMIVQEAHHRGCKAFAHANFPTTIQMCINAGFDTIEHINHLKIDQAKEMADKGIAAVSTYYVYKYLCDSMETVFADPNAIYTNIEDYMVFQRNAEAYERNFTERYKSGLTILAGTDCVFDGLEHVTVAWELEYMVKFGMPTLEAIAAATSKSAKVLGMEGKIGILAAGAIADIAIADADADKDITALKHIKDVYQDGKKVYREPEYING